MTRLTGRLSLLEFIEAEMARQKINGRQISRDAGLGINVISNLRYRTRGNVNFVTALALVNALGYELAIVPMEKPNG